MHKLIALAVFSTPCFLAHAASNVTHAANGAAIPHPACTNTYSVSAGGHDIRVPFNMVYIAPGAFTCGAEGGGKKVTLGGYCIGKFPVTNAEYQEFLAATSSSDYPRYWRNGCYPHGKANHPVVYVSLVQAKAYADWVSRMTGRKVSIPSSEQWEKAARGPNGYMYPWGDSQDTVYKNGKLTTKFNCNAVTAARYLNDESKKAVRYDNRRSTHFGQSTTAERIAAYDESGQATYLSVSENGAVRGWVGHGTYTGFIYTDLFTSINDAGGNTSAVGSYEAGKSGYGCYDMAGNIWNWCDTVIVARNGAERGKSVNEIRGGSWYANGTSCRCVSVGEGREGRGAYNTVGFRIVMVPEDPPK